MKLRALLSALLSLVVLALLSCGGDGGISGTGAPEGTLRLSLGDAPSCGYDEINITVQKVRVHQSATADDADAGWSEIVLAPAKRVDLLTLTNGVLAELGETPLPAGKYTQLRLVLADNDAAHPLANSVVPSGGGETALTTPSAQQSGLKANVDIEVAPNQLADFVIDFDACRSIVKNGKLGKYHLKPVIQVVPRLVSGVAGFVGGSIVTPGAGISLQQAGLPVKSTVADSSGHFLLQPVVPGSYDLVITAPGRATAVVTGVPVATNVVTTVNTAGSAIDPPASGSGMLDGTVVTGAASIDATVAVAQALTAGPTITLADAPVDASSGAYAYAVSVAAPLVAPYAALPAPLVFVADPGAAGRFTLTATAGGTTKPPAGPLTLTAGAVVHTDFVFP
ncbi:MAG TPA: DUF4382 domain-containing protein [Burkholderiaceae bacterium]|nr:DUF4382 domain-containing protein [Burkholderiaceae bacterium]